MPPQRRAAPAPPTLTPGAADFGKQAQGTASPAKTFTFTSRSNNTRVSDLTITGGGRSDFYISAEDCIGMPLNIGDPPCKIQVRFLPTRVSDPGDINATLSVDYNGGTATASLEGIGTAAPTDGATGATGATGSAGSSGSNGVNGSNGVSGANGSSGSNGASGVNGSNGVQGAQGAQGAPGPAGPAGPAGPQGASGGPGSFVGTGSFVGVPGASFGTTYPFRLLCGSSFGLCRVYVTRPFGYRAISGTIVAINGSRRRFVGLSPGGALLSTSGRAIRLGRGSYLIYVRTGNGAVGFGGIRRYTLTIG